MKKAITFLIFLIPILTIGQSNPFEKLKYDKVVAYEYQGEGGLLIERCLDEENDKINKTLNLTEKQTKNLEIILTSEKAYGNTTMSCFDPHFAVIYYLKEKVVGTINICLDCNYLIASEKIPATELKMIKISDDYSYPAKGFSKKTRKEIYEYIKGLGFTKYLRPLTSYLDE
ncbi:hypothetical protein [Winogradskyella endarachnes]|uniref:Uncharacterized protein n=1 Tax=Winogradskyella endarachnes TaxID=2681965 RepID=A0A6L6UC65_9FLAO|nr:hypothetical protein [Winogradskyella endarachnes]MUU79900.1 hypothetical protein [Winogradskyella endarachnes]